MADHPKTDEQFEAERDVRTLIDAGKIRKDKKRLTRAMKEGRAQRTALDEMGGGDDG